MAYSVQADVLKLMSKDSLIHLSNDSEYADVIDTDNLTQAIADADALINDYLRARYTVALTSVPDTVKKISIDLAIFNLWSRRPETVMPESVILRKTDALQYLKDVQAGKVMLETTERGSDPRYYVPSKVTTDQEFTDAELDTF